DSRLRGNERMARQCLLATRPRPSFVKARVARMSGAKCGIGRARFSIVPGFRCAHPGYETTKQQESGTPTDACLYDPHRTDAAPLPEPSSKHDPRNCPGHDPGRRPASFRTRSCVTTKARKAWRGAACRRSTTRLLPKGV